MTATALKLPERAAMPEPPPAIADDIAGRLAAAEQELAALEAQLPEASLAKELDEAGAADALSELDVAIRAASRKCERLRLSHNAALARDAVAARKQRHELRERELVDFQTGLAVRAAAAQDLAAGIAQATAGLHRYLKAMEGLRLLIPFGVVLHDHELMMLNSPNAEILAAREMWRLGVQLGPGGIPIAQTALPGARSANLENIGDPGGLPPLVDEVAATAEAILSIMRDRVAALA